jgi:flavodoxin
MNALVIYNSKFGNTERIARAIGEALRTRAVVDVQQIAEVSSISPAFDLLVVGGPTQGHGVDQDLKTFLDGLTPEAVQGVAVATFDTRLRWPVLLSGSAARGIAKRLGQKGACVIVEPESFFVEGGEGPLAEGEVARAASWARQLVDASAAAA